MFSNTQGKGFGITFANGWKVSVQWGPGNYGENYMGDFSEWMNKPCGSSYIQSRTAECAVFSPDGEFFPWWGKRNGDIKGYMTADEVAKLISAVSRTRRKAPVGV
jgi:hypothetical protein